MSIETFNEDITKLDLSNEINTNPFSNQNTNYIIQNQIDIMYKKHFPIKRVKFQKHKHKKSRILKSIKYKDYLYKKT